MRLWLAALLLLCSGSAAPARDAPGAILIFSHTSGYRHDSIPAGTAAVESLARERGLAVETSENPAIFAADRLARFRAIVLLSTTTDPNDPASEWLTGARRTALQRFVGRGGGVLAVHAAADSHYHWEWYGKLIGGRFARHPPGTPTGKLAVLPGPRPNQGLPPSIERADEWYYFDDLAAGSTWLVTLDPDSIGEPGDPVPVAWTREVNGGRMFYTALGHTRESYAEPFFLRHLANGLDWILAKP